MIFSSSLLQGKILIFSLIFIIQLFESVSFVFGKVSDNIEIIDDGYTSLYPPVDLSSDIISFICAILSAAMSILVFVMILKKHSSIFGYWKRAESEKLDKKERERQVIAKEKRHLMRRVLLSLLVSDIVCSFSRISYILFWWLCTLITPETMYLKSLIPINANQTTSIFHDSFDLSNIYSNLQNSTTLKYKANYNLKPVPLTIQKFLADLYYSFSISTAAWCVIIAYVVYSITSHSKWIEEDFNLIREQLQTDSHTITRNTAQLFYGNNASADSDEEIVPKFKPIGDLMESSGNSEIDSFSFNTMPNHDGNIENQSLIYEIPIKSSKSADEILYFSAKRRILSRRNVYELMFHLIAWGFSIFTFLFVFIFRTINIHAKDLVSDKFENWFLFSVYISWALYFSAMVFVNILILFLIWNYLRRFYRTEHIMTLPKKETKKQQRSMLVNLSLLMLPYAFCGLFELSFWYYNAIQIATEEEEAYYYTVIFYNFFFNVIVPLKGFFIALILLLSSTAIRKKVKSIVLCQLCFRASTSTSQSKRFNTTFIESLLIPEDTPADETNHLEDVNNNPSSGILEIEQD
ncbi:hypothetical protein NAEGRDRAFT_78550 [Naegleria gruberi]|uniref:Uncharacterized protein n=1 Tax=Naegleria gruberi TaxID=5762 RepID=D2V4J4_NAEGR|nr:uncharacterized protein NAEGRDRAFT_78550 [Naegleria gruberi]EFC48397.1 hypothetical protein NAEGRDRAFT_78550 [Naegleria gruberi]|eukprot:XP_002681141.1 hypothetical protein NAEGRDRAFT_78550 [Naegleria gruberi strain NEG-M]